MSDTWDEHRTFPMDTFLESYGKEHVSILGMKNEAVILSKVFVQHSYKLLINIKKTLFSAIGEEISFLEGNLLTPNMWWVVSGYIV